MKQSTQRLFSGVILIEHAGLEESISKGEQAIKATAELLKTRYFFISPYQ